MGREPLTKRLKREALERGAEVENKRKRVDDKPVSEESESESESDSEVERSLLASTREFFDLTFFQHRVFFDLKSSRNFFALPLKHVFSYLHQFPNFSYLFFQEF